MVRPASTWDVRVHVFLLNFTLYSGAVADSQYVVRQTGMIAEDCWPGSQKPGRLAALGR